MSEAVLARAIAAAGRIQAMPDDLPARLLARRSGAAVEAGRDPGPAPVLWLVSLAIAGASLALLAAAARADVAVGALVVVAGLAAALPERRRLALVRGALLALGATALLFPRVQRMEAQR